MAAGSGNASVVEMLLEYGVRLELQSEVSAQDCCEIDNLICMHVSLALQR